LSFPIAKTTAGLPRSVVSALNVQVRPQVPEPHPSLRATNVRCNDQKAMTKKDLRVIINFGASRMLKQFEKSNGFNSIGDSQIAEAAAVAHIASSFIASGHSVWPESPFKSRTSLRAKRLDLLIDCAPDSTPKPEIVMVEAKAIASGQLRKKFQEILEDGERIRSWPSLESAGRPLFFVASPPRKFWGVLLVLLTEDCDKSGKVRTDATSKWWKTLRHPPVNIPATLIAELQNYLQKPAWRDVVRSSTWDGCKRIAIASAIFVCQDKSSR
jgi:hypothetical protein